MTRGKQGSRKCMKERGQQEEERKTRGKEEEKGKKTRGRREKQEEEWKTKRKGSRTRGP